MVEDTTEIVIEDICNQVMQSMGSKVTECSTEFMYKKRIKQRMGGKLN